MRSRLSLAVGLAAAFALNVATPANAHDSSKHSSKRSQVTTPKAGTVKQRVRRNASNVSRAYRQAPYDAGDANYGSTYGWAWSAAGPYYGGPYYGDAYYGGGAYYGDPGFAYRYGQAPFESPGPAPRQSRMRANANRDTSNTYSQPSTEAGAAQARFESSGSPAEPTTRPTARQRTRANANDAGSAYGQAPSERSARPTSNREQSGQSGQTGQSGQCFISVDSDRGQGYYGDCSTKGARQVK